MPPTKPDVEAVTVRLDPATRARIDALAAALTLRGSQPNRCMALRAAILMGLDAFEAERLELAPKPKKGGPR